MHSTHLTTPAERIRITAEKRRLKEPLTEVYMKRRRLTVLRIVLTVLSAAALVFIFYNSSLDAVESSEQSGTMLGGINAFLRSLGIPIELSDHFIRKTAHFVEYFVLGGLFSLTAFAYVRTRSRMLMIALPLGAAAAVTDELIQLGSAGRSCEVADMALDFCAVLTASLIVTLILYLIDRHKKKKAETQREGIQGE